MSSTTAAEATVAPASAPPLAAPPAPPPKKEWAPRIWEGIDFLAWMRLLIQNRFNVDWSHLYIAVIVTFVSFCHMILRWVQSALYGARIARTPVKHAPIFIVGHWRTGTTLLHELLILDPRHTYPNTYQCLEPNHFLLTEGLVKKYLPFLMPARRPMDNMAAGWERPQEDEFALCMMGAPSPYQTIAFPKHGPAATEYFDLDSVTPRARAGWKRAFYRFIQTLTFVDPRRLVLKSPPHSCRIKHLLDLFPDARFVHITRNPYVLLPSTLNLWRTLYETHGLQKLGAGDWLEEYVLSTFEMLYDCLEKGSQLLRVNRFYELRYEDLLQDPMGEMSKLYEALSLDGFDELKPRLEAYWSRNAEYQTNRYRLSDDMKAKVRQRWSRVIEFYGYEEPM